VDYDLINWMLVFARCSAFLIVLPIFSTPNIPVRVRVSLAAFIALLLAPLLPPLATKGITLFGWFGLFAMEVLSGLVIGFVTRMVFFTADFAGRLIANELGLNMASIVDPFSGASNQAPGFILFFLTAVMMMSLDMHHWLITGFQMSYTLLPIGGAHLSEMLLKNVVDHTSRVLFVGVQIAAPLIAVSFLVMLVLSVMGRMVPQMNVFSESFGIRIIAGMAVLGFTMELTAQHLLNGLRRLPEDMLLVAQFLGGQ
jgi:flagellar biosynthetic protein FliR